jgi:proline-specific peptidase
MKTEEGTIELESGFKIWYRCVGNGDATPLLLLHGGPGAGHDYLEPLDELADTRRVVFYDQLGCGKSERPDDVGLWTLERFVREVDEVRAALGLESVHLLGQSWGGWLGIEYMLSQPAGVQRLVLASTSASMPQFAAETRRLREDLPVDVQQVLNKYEAVGDYHNPEYEEAVMAFYQKHLCRLPEWPDCVMRTVANLENNPVYETMNGPNEFTTIGNLKDWDRTERDADHRRTIRRTDTRLRRDPARRDPEFPPGRLRRQRTSGARRGTSTLSRSGSELSRRKLIRDRDPRLIRSTPCRRSCAAPRAKKMMQSPSLQVDARNGAGDRDRDL